MAARVTLLCTESSLLQPTSPFEMRRGKPSAGAGSSPKAGRAKRTMGAAFSKTGRAKPTASAALSSTAPLADFHGLCGNAAAPECPVCLSAPKRGAVLLALCAHPICTECILRHVKIALNENKFPIQCPLKAAETWPTPRALLAASPDDPLRKKLEHTLVSYTPHLTTCPSPRCRAAYDWTKRVEQDGPRFRFRLTCPKCGERVCLRCKDRLHDGLCVGEDDGRMEKQFENLVATRGWRYCPQCGSVVERISGCRFMKCRCGKRFCYTCGNSMFGELGEQCWCEDE